MEESQADIKVSNNNPSNSSNPGNNDEEASNDMIDGVPVKDQRTRPIFKPENLYYDMSGEKFLIIFNHFVYEPSAYYSYKPPSPRKGTDKDVAALKQVFGSLGFKVLTFTDLKHEEILKKISTISNQDHSRTSCLAVAILTHGDTGGMLKASDRAYYLKDITAMFEHGHPTLVNKPKLFFIQACRGGRTDAGRRTQYDGTDDNTLVVPSHSDFLFLYSTVEDHLSWRDVGGSWLIQEFCEVLKTHSQSYDLLQLITIATRNVAYDRSSNTPSDKSTHNKKQTPETRFTLTKLLMF